MKPKKFEVGDIVRRIDGWHGSMREGDIAKIRVIEACGALSLKGYGYGHSPDMFELVTPSSPRLESVLKKAIELQGKKVTVKGSGSPIPFTLNKFVVITSPLRLVPCERLTSFLKEHGFVVWTNTGSQNVNVNDLEVLDNVVKLNDKYSAVIEDGKVKVGCQSFDPESIKNLHDTMVSLGVYGE